jgi:hydroxyacylglutathione hydrolase
MIWQVLADPAAGCLSYLVGDEVAGEGLVVDPLASLGVEAYVEATLAAGLGIQAVVETHVHADHRSAARELAEGMGAQLALAAQAGPRYPFRPLADGDQWRLGDVEVTVWETPGHTPDALSLVITDRRRGDEPWAVLTGDSLFVGDVGRPDLAEPTPEAVRDACLEQYRSVRRLLRLPDFTEVWPAHYGASACGGLYMSRKPSSTVGYERRYNRFLQVQDPDEFAEMVLRLLKPPPPEAQWLRQANLGRGEDA